MKMIFCSSANKTHLHKKGFALNLVLKVSLWNSSLRTHPFLHALRRSARNVPSDEEREETIRRLLELGNDLF